LFYILVDGRYLEKKLDGAFEGFSYCPLEKRGGMKYTELPERRQRTMASGAQHKRGREAFVPFTCRSGQLKKKAGDWWTERKEKEKKKKQKKKSSRKKEEKGTWLRDQGRPL